MKKTFFSLLFIGLLSVVLVSCTGNNNANQQQVAVPSAQEQPVQPVPAEAVPAEAAPAANQALPEGVTAFIQQYFPGATVVRVETDSEHGGVEYEVNLNDGTEVDFDVNNQWEKVDCRTKAVPAALVPKAIAGYVKSNYQNLSITKIHKEHYGYEIELSNGLDLNFDRSGQFMGVDD